ncbi:MAG: nitrile hydratase accessory protein, partial [Roseobacter sp.]
MRPLEPVFTQPWHAQLFALTVHLNESGWMGWPDWADAFGATLKRHGL